MLASPAGDAFLRAPLSGGSPPLTLGRSPASVASSHVGSLCDGLPAYVYDPPIEAVVFAWGVNEDGQLGLEKLGGGAAAENVLAPKVVEACLGTRFRGREFGCSPLVASSRNTLAIDADGSVITWGWNDRGTLGHGHRQPSYKPQRVAGLAGVRIKQASIGGWHVLALDEDGQCWAWGGNEYGQCAPNEPRDCLTPVRCLPGMRVKQVAAGGMHSLALTENGEIWVWGEPWGDFSMQINRAPRRIDTSGDFVDISCGAFHNLALNAAGECFTWGINDFGMLGNGTTSYATEPERVVGLEEVFIADVAAGGWHSMAISAEGEVYVWGRGEYGRLGLGDRTGSSKLRPQKVKALEGHRVVEGTCGGTHTMVVTDEGRCFIWGRGAFGRLGTGLQKDCISPVELKLPGGPERWRVISISAGGRHSVVLALPDNGNLGRRQAEWSERKPFYQSSPPASQLGRDRSWAHSLHADDEQEDGGVSPEGRSEGASDYADEGMPEGPSPQPSAHRAFSSHHLQQMEMAAALEGGGSTDNLRGGNDMDSTPAQAAAAAAAARVHGLRDDAPGHKIPCPDKGAEFNRVININNLSEPQVARHLGSLCPGGGLNRASPPGSDVGSSRLPLDLARPDVLCIDDCASRPLPSRELLERLRWSQLAKEEEAEGAVLSKVKLVRPEAPALALQAAAALPLPQVLAEVAQYMLAGLLFFGFLAVDVALTGGFHSKIVDAAEKVRGKLLPAEQDTA
ncbi:ultraviolet-B receptor UVR8-like [Micractinium conductrix]|uniref:Ultraviolet-B receptor UVR8-like n=1 Tax=Micractinium conductrix TaxID=554055 RepID=A0A2P6VNH6_9CHLO|nr:ultraviolet-B receptor UVR8-like [Micractinium conductrix]|eukprot:PSC75605.1 ultraviolet-B receptor UVR8-like [Micractinium conductrix]